MIRVHGSSVSLFPGRPRQTKKVRAPSGKILGPLVRPEVVSKHVPQRVELFIRVRVGPPERALVARDFAI